MTDEVYIVGDEVISPFGLGSDLNFRRLLEGDTAVTQVMDTLICDHPIHAARMDETQWTHLVRNASCYTRLERLFILALQRLINNYSIPLDNGTLLIISTTKGNIRLLANLESSFSEERASITAMAQAIRHYFGFDYAPIPISYACISGSLAISVARRLLYHDHRYQRAIVLGGDELSKFI